MSKRKKFPRTISYALTGWFGMVGFALFLLLAWPIFFPAIVRTEHYYDDGPVLVQALAIAILIATPAALVGGIVGGRISQEGGDRAQRLVAIIFGIIFSIPFSCYILWIFTGF